MHNSTPDLNLVHDLARDRIHKEAAGVAAVVDYLDESFARVVELLLKSRGKVFVTGSGTSGFIARRMAHLLTVCGTPALYIQPMDALHGTMGAITAADILIAISRGGSSDEINELARRIKELGVPIVTLTSAPASPLAGLADISVILPAGNEIDPGDIVAMGSTLAVGVWGDALSYVLMVLRGHSWEKVLHNHPAGAVGKINEAPPAISTPDA